MIPNISLSRGRKHYKNIFIVRNYSLSVEHHSDVKLSMLAAGYLLVGIIVYPTNQ